MNSDSVCVKSGMPSVSLLDKLEYHHPVTIIVSIALSLRSTFEDLAVRIFLISVPFGIPFLTFISTLTEKVVPTGKNLVLNSKVLLSSV